MKTNEFGSEEEVQELETWANKHLDECPIEYAGAIGGRFSYIFCPTSIGTVCKIKCECGAEHDATKYDNW